MGHGVVAGPHHLDAVGFENLEGIPELIVAVADFQAEVVQADPATGRNGLRLLADLDEQ